MTTPHPPKQKLDAILDRPIKDLITEPQELIAVSSTSSVWVALETLIKHNIYQAPVFTANEDDTVVYEGIVELVDIVTFLSMEMTLFDKVFTKAAKDEFTSVRTAAIVGLSKRNRPTLLDSEDPVRLALQVLGSQAHAAPIALNGKLVSIATQGMIFRWLHHAGLSNLVDTSQTLAEAGLGGSDLVYSTKLSDPARDAFLLMAKHGIGGIPVVDEEGAVCGALSAKDLKVIITRDSFELLRPTVTVQHYMSSVRQLYVEKATAAAVTIHNSDPLSKLFDRFFATRLHRLFLVDAQSKPLRVISLSDVLGFLARKTHGL